MKECFKCKKIKRLEEFYSNKQMRDGRYNKCKECMKLYEHLRRYGPSREKILAYDRDRGGRVTSERSKAYRKRNALKYKAHILAQRIPKKPCEICGKVKWIHRHHDDYNKPMQVRFLCAEHHRQHHSEMKWASKKEI